MPIYEYLCSRCDHLTTRYRQVAKRDDRLCCEGCGRYRTVERVVSLPAVNVWNAERRFPNLRQDGDGSMAFPSKAAYESYLKSKGIHEIGIRAPVKRPHGNRVVGTWR